MRLYLIRHAESEHNVAQVCAGVTDSALTNHGILQIERLGHHFRVQGVQFTRVFASPLQRARMTALGLCQGSNGSQLQLLPILRERDFGSFEGKSWRTAVSARTTNPSNPPSDHKKPESTASMAARVNAFLSDFLFPVLHADKKAEEVVAIVSHGIILSVLWDTLAKLCKDSHLVFSRSVQMRTRRPGWSNTGYMELDIVKASRDIPRHVSYDSASLEDLEKNAHRTSCAQLMTDSLTVSLKITVHTVNERQHLRNLKRTGSGAGSATHDSQQKRINQFFKKPNN